MKLCLRQGWRRVELVVTGSAWRRPVPVFLQQRHAWECLAAGRARISLGTGVRLRMRAQVGPVGEGAVTVGTSKRFLAGVRAQVSLQQPRPRERFAAQLAAARQRVRSDVHLERTCRRVGLGRRSTGRSGDDAVSADELASGTRRDAVELAVLRQAVVRRVTFAARLALEARRSRRPPVHFRFRFHHTAATAAAETGRTCLLWRWENWAESGALLVASWQQFTLKLIDDGLSQWIGLRADIDASKQLMW